MALFGFSKKKNTTLEPSAPGIPIEQILSLKQQGMDNNQIIQDLERQGYNSSQIFDALNQVNISGAGQGIEEPPGYSSQSTQQDFSYNQPFLPEQEPEQFAAGAGIDREQIEEIAEAIIDEKWKEFEDDVRKIIEWKDLTEARISKLDQQIKDLYYNLNSLHKNLLNKVSEYDRNITEVGTEIKAMEKVFQNVLPSMTENVNKLERMAKSSEAKKKTTSV